MPPALKVRGFEERDSGSMVRLAGVTGMPLTLEDLRVFMGYEPDGYFAAELGGEFAGAVGSISYGRMGWVSWLMVEPRFRRRGVATALMDRVVRHLKERGGEVVRLESTPMAVPLYRNLGFTVEFETMRLRGVGRTAPCRGVSPMREEDIDDVIGFDTPCFGADRSRVLRRIFQDHPDQCFISRASKGEVEGYIMGQGDKIGPWVSKPQGAERLLGAVLSAVKGRTATVCIPLSNTHSSRMLGDYGFTKVIPHTRMRIGENICQGEIRMVYALAAFAIG